ncbi:conserved exported hypothetical protein [Alteromonas sp. 38]|nr:conserved exported hypothetical protein [Alteromonas sp. 154]VXC53412.1 conserved exported hypothetical protein [Alteromonas sp. 38]
MRITLLISTLAFSLNCFSAGSGTGDQNIELVEITSWDNLRIKLVNEQHSSTCVTSGKEKEIVIPKDDNNFDHFMTIALTAFTTNKKIYMWLDNDSCVTQGATRYPRPMTMALRNY